MDRVEQRDDLLGLVRLELADQVERDVGSRLAQLGHLPRPPARDSRRTRAGRRRSAGGSRRASCILEMAISVDRSGFRPAMLCGAGDLAAHFREPLVGFVYWACGAL
jgi:hypothetical protein